MVHILTVCTGNICRSPLAEFLLKQGLPGSLMTVSSAGTNAVNGAGMPAHALRLAGSMGISTAEAEAHRARRIEAVGVAEASLILTMSRDHRRQIIEEWVESRRKVFTIREFARLLTGVDPQQLSSVVVASSSFEGAFSEMVEIVASQRGSLSPPRSLEDDDIVDPFLRSWRVYRKAGKQLHPSADRVVKFLGSIAELDSTRRG